MSDYLVFVKNFGINKVIIVIVYIKNNLFFGPDLTEINIVKSILADQDKMNNLDSCELFSKIKLEQNLEAKIISLFQKVYV